MALVDAQSASTKPTTVSRIPAEGCSSSRVRLSPSSWVASAGMNASRRSMKSRIVSASETSVKSPSARSSVAGNREEGAVRKRGGEHGNGVVEGLRDRSFEDRRASPAARGLATVRCARAAAAEARARAAPTEPGSWSVLATAAREVAHRRPDSARDHECRCERSGRQQSRSASEPGCCTSVASPSRLRSSSTAVGEPLAFHGDLASEPLRCFASQPRPFPFSASAVSFASATARSGIGGTAALQHGDADRRRARRS